LKAVSIPSFICRPSSLAAPENGAAIPNRISRSVMPRGKGPVGTGGTEVVGAVAAFAAVAAAAEDGPMTLDRLGPPSERSDR
jgi:hypothetical protein